MICSCELMHVLGAEALCCVCHRIIAILTLLSGS